MAFIIILFASLALFTFIIRMFIAYEEVQEIEPFTVNINFTETEKNED